ncbi:hypothetical protein AVEN_106577-1, partial [Araneus ventricosus]
MTHPLGLESARMDGDSTEGVEEVVVLVSAAARKIDTCLVPY